MLHWIPYVFVRLVLFFAAGVALAIAAPGCIPQAAAIALLLAVAVVFGVVAVGVRRVHVVGGLLGLSAVALAGYVAVTLKTASHSRDNIVHLTTPVDCYRAVVSTAPMVRARSYRLQVAVNAVYTNGRWHPCSGTVMLYIRKDSNTFGLQYGDVLVVRGQPRTVPLPGNPREFDYKTFLSYRGIYHQHFVQRVDVHRLGYDPPGYAMKYAIDLRHWADAALKRYIQGAREQALASALVLGVTDTLDNELLAAYSATGTLHVLSVSGLHVGILYGVLLLLFRPFKKMPPAIVAAASLLVLWTYAFVSGLSPSVLRAVTMFSFMCGAQVLRRSSNIYNTLGASAFCLLLYDPFMIMSVGFQLSYLAVLGIVYLQPGLYRLWEPRAWLWDEVWKVTSVSLAAQVATAPLGLFYFHQFPNYFLFSNLLAIPLSSAVLIGGLVVIAGSFVPVAAHVLGWLLTWIIKALNGVVFYTEALPGSTTNNVFITPAQFIILTLLLVAVVRLVETRRFAWVGMAALLCVGFGVLHWQRYTSVMASHHMVVYQVRGATAIDFIERGAVMTWADATVDDAKLAFHIMPHRIASGATQATAVPAAMVRVLPGCRLVAWHGKVWLQVMERSAVVPAGIAVDYLVISKNAVADLRALLKKIKVATIIIDSSNSLKFANNLVQQAGPVPVRSVLHEGAVLLYP